MALKTFQVANEMYFLDGSFAISDGFDHSDKISAIESTCPSQSCSQLRIFFTISIVSKIIDFYSTSPY